MRALILCLLAFVCVPQAVAAQPAVAFYYGTNPPWDELRAFDWVVLEPEHVESNDLQKLAGSEVYAYVSVGEVDPSRAWLKKLPAEWMLGTNKGWNSFVIDQSQPGWPDFFVDNVIAPLWARGFRGFFLDTLDSYQLYARDDQTRAKQQNGLVRLIHTLKARYPDAKLFFNRGFEVLPQVHSLATAVAAESLFASWDSATQQYQPVSEENRVWLLNQLNQVRRDYGLPVVVIDYLPPGQRQKARAVAEKIRALGFIPWVTNSNLTMLGVGMIEVMPRKVLMLYNDADDETALMVNDVVRNGTLPLNYLGYKADYLDARSSLPNYPLIGRYAGVVIWLQSSLSADRGRRLAEWVVQQTSAGLPVLVLGDMAFLKHADVLQQLGLQCKDATRPARQVSIVEQTPMVGFEIQPLPDRSRFFPLAIRTGTPLVVVADEQGRRQVAAAIMPWGGYALDPFTVLTLPGGAGKRWVIDPFALMQQALRLPTMPVPDVSTESGRRMLLVHIDGDGFPSRAEFPGAPYAAEVLYKQILQRYRIPTTFSIIEGEIGPAGLYPELSPKLEAIARAILALPHVEIASHTYSHPFFWGKAERQTDAGDYTLHIPGYQLDLHREITGSIEYIESRLAPPGKKVVLLHWSGDCNPTINALAETVRAGVGNINGGETVITRSLPTLTAVAPLGVQKGPYFQVFAPNQNENVYTNHWTSSFYGYSRVIETFEMTETPRRLKPINIYYHSYTASKPASLAALDKVYRWAMQQKTTPVYTSEYVRKVQDFNHITVARTADGWRIRGLHDLRQLRIPAVLGQPDLRRSRGIAGFNVHLNQCYIHAGAEEVEVVLTSQAQKTPRLISANAPLRAAARQNGELRLEFTAHVPLQLEVADTAYCIFTSAGQRLIAKHRSTGTQQHTYTLNHHAAAPIEVRCTSS
ncbi:MAG: bifunctional glycoside hydrolase 114/ polysaccharide deacetylase family protein [Aggregatilineaceae bacterium]